MDFIKEKIVHFRELNGMHQFGRGNEVRKPTLVQSAIQPNVTLLQSKELGLSLLTLGIRNGLRFNQFKCGELGGKLFRKQTFQQAVL